MLENISASSSNQKHNIFSFEGKIPVNNDWLIIIVNIGAICLANCFNSIDDRSSWPQLNFEARATIIFDIQLAFISLKLNSLDMVLMRKDLYDKFSGDLISWDSLGPIPVKNSLNSFAIACLFVYLWFFTKSYIKSFS